MGNTGPGVTLVAGWHWYGNETTISVPTEVAPYLHQRGGRMLLLECFGIRL